MSIRITVTKTFIYNLAKVIRPGREDLTPMEQARQDATDLLEGTIDIEDLARDHGGDVETCVEAEELT